MIAYWLFIFLIVNNSIGNNRMYLFNIFSCFMRLDSITTIIIQRLFRQNVV